MTPKQELLLKLLEQGESFGLELARRMSEAGEPTSYSTVRGMAARLLEAGLIQQEKRRVGCSHRVFYRKPLPQPATGKG